MLMIYIDKFTRYGIVLKTSDAEPWGVSDVAVDVEQVFFCRKRKHNTTISKWGEVD